MPVSDHLGQDLDDEEEKDVRKYERTFSDLEKSEQAILSKIKTGDDIETMELLEFWMDDHIVCVGAKINGVEVGFWCCGPEMAGYLVCTDSKIAKTAVATAVVNEVKMDAE